MPWDAPVSVEFSGNYLNVHIRRHHSGHWRQTDFVTCASLAGAAMHQFVWNEINSNEFGMSNRSLANDDGNPSRFDGRQ